jgi:hypothetical protein
VRDCDPPGQIRRRITRDASELEAIVRDGRGSRLDIAVAECEQPLGNLPRGAALRHGRHGVARLRRIALELDRAHGREQPARGERGPVVGILREAGVEHLGGEIELDERALHRMRPRGIERLRARAAIGEHLEGHAEQEQRDRQRGELGRPLDHPAALLAMDVLDEVARGGTQPSDSRSIGAPLHPAHSNTIAR